MVVIYWDDTFKPHRFEEHSVGRIWPHCTCVMDRNSMCIPQILEPVRRKS